MALYLLVPYTDATNPSGELSGLTGTIREVDPDTLVAQLSDLERIVYDDADNVIAEAAPWNMGTGQIAFAFGDGADKVLVSPPWEELSSCRRRW